MAGYRRFINSGSVLYTRNSLLNFCQNGLINTLRYQHNTVLPPKPKKPQTAFLLYLNRVRSKLREENPHMKTTEVVKKASHQYAELNTEEKENLRNQYVKQYKIYIEKLQEYNDSLTDEQKQLLKEKSQNRSDKETYKYKCETFGKPKKPLSPFLQFMLSKKSEMNPNLSYKEWMQSLSTKWKTMSAEEKEPYTLPFRNLMTQYKENIEEWEKKMKMLGHFDIVRHKDVTKKRNKNEN